MKNYFMRIDCNEKDQSSYRRIEISLGSDQETVKFETGDLIIDYIDMQKWLAEQEFDNLLYSSSVDHFFMDGNLYDEMPIKIISQEGKPNKYKFGNWGDYDFRSVRKKGMKKFSDIQKYYKENKK